MNEPVIEVDHLTKNFGSFCAVNGISFSVPKGKIIGFLGPNGAGKTTTIHSNVDVVLTWLHFNDLVEMEESLSFVESEYVKLPINVLLEEKFVM